MYPSRYFIPGEGRAGEGLQFGLGGHGAFVQNHGTGDVLTQRGVGTGEGGNRFHRGMLTENLVDLRGQDLLSATIDDLFETAG